MMLKWNEKFTNRLKDFLFEKFQDIDTRSAQLLAVAHCTLQIFAVHTQDFVKKCCTFHTGLMVYNFENI